MANEPKWTPGPWRIEKCGRKYVAFNVLADPPDWPDMVILLGIGESAPNRTLETEKANATLAAQSPAMYILLDKIREYLIQNNLCLWLQYDEHRCQPLILTIERLLSEARGKQPTKVGESPDAT